MTPPGRPPAISRKVLQFAARRLDLPDLVDDAAAVFEGRQTSHGRAAAARWYRAQARSAMVRVLRHWVAVSRRPALSGISLDARLGFRMLRRYPGVTIVGSIAMAFAIFVGSVLFEFINQTMPDRTLPIPHGERVVGLRWWDRAGSAPRQLSVADVEYWQTTVSSLELVGGFSTATRQVDTTEGQSSVEQVALMSPSGFTLAGAVPIVGRVFTDHDLVNGNTAVVVINESTWNIFFARATDVVGRQLRVSDQPATVIGVLPDSFKFPISQTLWMPLDPRNEASPALRGFGRLVPGATLEQAQHQITALAAAAPTRATGAVDRQLAAQVQWYRESLFDVPVTLLLRVVVQQINAFAALFLMLVASNIALLMFARAATRERELVVRTALGAGRRRIVTQFLVEALALFALATTAGLLATGPGLAWVERRIGEMGGGSSPFWFSASVSVETITYAAVLTVLAALMSGGIPAMRATRQLSASRIQDSGSAGRLTLGGIWSVVVVAQVAATVVFTSGALLMWRQARLTGSVDARFVAQDYVDVYLQEADAPRTGGQVDRALRLAKQLERVQGVVGVTVADRLPLMSQNRQHIEVEGAADPIEVSMPRVASNFFEVFQAPLVAGRYLQEADRGVGADAVVVDQAFVDTALGGRNAVGRRLRVTTGPEQGMAGPWLQIVGVVRSLETDPPGRLYLDNQTRPFVYRAFAHVDSPPLLRVGVHAPRLDAATLNSIRRTASAAAGGGLTVLEVQPLDQLVRTDAAFWQLWAELILIASVVALLLALAGIYAVMSFTVTRRTREIGIRMALGAGGTRVAVAVLQRPARQVCAGVCLGCLVVAGLYWTVAGTLAWSELLSLALFAAVMAAVCGLACLGPARRALAVEPTKAIAG